jgi:hypothetical protein
MTSPNIATGDRIEFTNAEGYRLAGLVRGVFGDCVSVAIKSGDAAWRQLVPFDQIRIVDRTERNRGLGLILL